MLLRVIATHEIPAYAPIELHEGDAVALVRRDGTWPDFVWCETIEGGGGWIPDAYLLGTGEQRRLRRDYSSRELPVGIGDIVTLTDQYGGWYCARDVNQQTGWIPAECAIRYDVDAGAGNVTCVILAAGRSRRFGSDKLLHRLPDGGTLLERALRACTAYDTVVVCSPHLIEALSAAGAQFIVNELPALGMAHSLQLANATIDPLHDVAVLPADLAFIERKHVALTIGALHDADLAYPRRADGTPGHPVVFSARARERILQLPHGDSIKLLRDRADFTRRIVAVEAPWPYRDVDYESDLEFL